MKLFKRFSQILIFLFLLSSCKATINKNNRIIDSEKKLFDATISFSKTFQTSSPQAMAAAIKSINSAYLFNGEDVETEEFGKLFETEGFKEGVSAFLEKRKPQFNK